jgi:hypothetical protein
MAYSPKSTRSPSTIRRSSGSFPGVRLDPPAHPGEQAGRLLVPAHPVEFEGLAPRAGGVEPRHGTVDDAVLRLAVVRGMVGVLSGDGLAAA